MASAGWYPDPSGVPDSFRYWDGAAWSHQTAAHPHGPPPGPQYGSYGQGGPGWTGSGTPAPPTVVHPSRGGSTVLLVLAAVVVVALVATGAFIGVRALNGGGDDARADPPLTSGSDPTSSSASSSSPAPSPTPSPTDGGTVRPTSLECTGGDPTGGAHLLRGGSVHGGGLSVPAPPGFLASLDASPAFTFANQVFAPSKEIETAEQGAGWIATYALGGLNRANGFGDTQQTAGAILTCMTESKEFYRGFTGRTDLDSRSVSVDGHPGWEVDAEIRVHQKGLTVPGDVAKVIAVDVGDPASYGLFVSVVPIGDQRLIRQQSATAAALTVE